MKSAMFAAAFAIALLPLSACGQQSGGDDVMQAIHQADADDAQAAQDAQAEGARFLTAAKAHAGAVTTSSGLVFEVVRRGSNQRLPRPPAGAQVLVHYEGKLADGSVFDSSIQRGEPAQFGLGDVGPGFSEAIQLMRPGDEVIATFPAELGYGPEGRPPVIPPNATLQFRIILLAFQDASGHSVQAPNR